MNSVAVVIERMVVTDDGVRLWTVEDGSGPELVLCHGGPGLWDYFAPVSSMVPRDARVVRWDQRGCGRSAPASVHSVLRSPVEEAEYRLLSWRPDFAAPERAAELIAQFDEPYEINREANRRINLETKAWIESDLALQCRAMVAPTLVMHGERDPRPAWAIDSLAAALPNASIEILPGVGQLPWLESPEVFAQCLRSFLRTV
jgi:pimeloyl-ACP methyl ester carboxylesterase